MDKEKNGVICRENLSTQSPNKSDNKGVTSIAIRFENITTLGIWRLLLFEHLLQIAVFEKINTNFSFLSWSVSLYLIIRVKLSRKLEYQTALNEHRRRGDRSQRIVSCQQRAKKRN